ncbi:hypothetical protein HALLA_12710 [Halostagnicola larsenii XH-48]|uniref:Uncharacterized protein n=1 Tax=Halostagnicola larsenii XH-48 TaxID=797299 RepID=W0JQJ5_9EURY|nr:hypothetical protein HALLA_12710 [Halostagnicola larsenii XH-48]
MVACSSDGRKVVPFSVQNLHYDRLQSWHGIGP